MLVAQRRAQMRRPFTCSEEEELCYNVVDDLVKQFDDSSDEDD